MVAVPRIVGLVTGLLGIVTSGVCIWLIADPVKFGFGIANWDGGDSPKIGIAAAALMIVVGISFFFIKPEERLHFFAGALVVILVLSIAFMSVAVKDHQDLKEISDIQKNLENINPLSEINFGSSKTIENINIKSVFDDSFEIYDKILARLKAVAAIGGIDSIAMIICLAVLCKYR